MKINPIFLYIIISSCIQLYLVYKYLKFEFSIEKQTTIYNKTVLGYKIILYKKSKWDWLTPLFSFYIPLRNKNKIQLKEHKQKLIELNSQQRRQRLSAIFSWLKTIEEVKAFEQDYYDVDPVYVEQLVNSFISKNYEASKPIKNNFKYFFKKLVVSLNKYIFRYNY